ncbi:DUF2007 domain-containing protein [Salinimicrobium sp. GXAS 041]|uniref:putative signal transducing protein n=1 Tax=Salinimicrobium sp. GXAS 041 TaxID=3400806 RepID=UPI003C7559A5
MFTIVKVFQYSAEAQVMKGRFEAEGIPSFLRDNHTIDTDPLVSNAIGGVKLAVFEKDYQKAVEILDSINKYSTDDEGKEIICPECGSSKVELLSNVKDIKSLLFFVFSFFMTALPIYVKYEYRCENCKNKFRLK